MDQPKHHEPEYDSTLFLISSFPSFASVNTSPHKTRLLLTGATGFIGSHVLEALTAKGRPVVVLARPTSNVAHARSLGAEIRCGDVSDLASVRAAMRGCAQVVHAAARATDWASAEDFHRTNVIGTCNILEAARLEGIVHTILTGSNSSYGEENSLRPKDESSPYKSHYPYFLDRIFPCAFNGYRDSKAASTEQAVVLARAHQLNVTILEPIWVYGEREFGTGFYSYVKAVQSGARWMPGSPRNLFQVCYAKDLARAYVLACEKRLPGVERIIVGDPAPVPMRQVFGLFCREAGLSAPRLLPKWGTYPIGFALELCYTLTGRRHPPLLTRGRVNTFYDSIQFSTAKARHLLGFECAYTLEQGIRQTVRWYKDNGYL